MGRPRLDTHDRLLADGRGPRALAFSLIFFAIMSVYSLYTNGYGVLIGSHGETVQDGKMVLKHKQEPTFSDMRSVDEEQFKRSVKDCTSKSNKFDQQTLDCMRGR